MEKFIIDERTGLRYELVGDYYLIAGDDEPEEEQKPIGIWGQRHLRYLKNHRKVLYANLLTSGKLDNYLADINKQAEEMFERLTRRMAVAEDITEQLKATDQMVWVGRMNNIVFNVPSSLLFPVLCILGRSGITAIMAMPKTSVNKNCNPFIKKDEIRVTFNIVFSPPPSDMVGGEILD